ncbi:MAG: oligoendopeptidase F [Acidobacteria bacterium]|nr:oligoendopeptidase F [Acidobacteriota bacterium]MBV9187210.1 oligoendopeptidase F [Acidobacteriota bacterium]
MRMMRVAVAVVVVALTASAGFAQSKERADIPEQSKWRLTDLYPSDEAWRVAKDKLVARIPEMKKYKGTLGQSPQQLAAGLTLLNDLNKEFSRVYVYAGLIADQDTRVTKYRAMKQEMDQLGSSFGADIAFVEPEILKIDRATIDSYIAKEPKLAPYTFYLHDLLRRQAHTLSEPEEKIIADAGLMSSAPGDVYGVFTNADFPFPTITLADGTTRKLDLATFSVSRSLPNREDRKKVFDAFFGALGDYRGTIGTALNAEVQKDLFYMRARKYPTTLDATLEPDSIPTSVYTKLIDGVNANLPTFHRYLNLRKRMLGLSDLHYYDLYAPLVANTKLEYSLDEAKKNLLGAVAPLGTGYTSVIERAFNDRWIDLYPNAGKRTGAYSNGGAYDVHPFMLINYNGRYDDMSTVAHELGHTMQSYFSNKTQPYPTAGYPIFVAEVASTFNEALLNDYMLKQIKDPATRLSLLGNYLEGMKGTVFRQTQFAEFELRIHQAAEKGEPLTGDTFDTMYLDIVKRYYGDDKGVCKVDDVVKHEWAYIPHFYRTYYVYQYATSATASAALSEKVMSGDANATKRYLAFLSAGGSKYPIDLLKDAGVDMTTSEPLDLTMKKMNRVMDEMDAILKQMGK